MNAKSFHFDHNSAIRHIHTNAKHITRTRSEQDPISLKLRITVIII